MLCTWKISFKMQSQKWTPHSVAWKRKDGGKMLHKYCAKILCIKITFIILYNILNHTKKLFSFFAFFFFLVCFGIWIIFYNCNNALRWPNDDEWIFKTWCINVCSNIDSTHSFPFQIHIYNWKCVSSQPLSSISLWGVLWENDNTYRMHPNFNFLG